MKTCEPFIVLFIYPLFLSRFVMLAWILINKFIVSFKEKLDDFVIVIIGSYMEQRAIFRI